VQQKDYDMLILVVSMPGRNGLDALAELKLIKPKLPVLVLSSHPDGQYALWKLSSGCLQMAAPKINPQSQGRKLPPS
jgi:two-component system, NarL family, invasion response regulator UvrY